MGGHESRDGPRESGETDRAEAGAAGHSSHAAGGDGGDAHDGHDHGVAGTSSRKLAAVSGINLAGFVVELAGGLAFGSVALVSDAVHMLFDATAYLLAFGAAYVAERFGPDDRWSYGLHRLEPLAAFLNGVLLLPMVAFILWEAYRRFLDPVAIGVGPTLAVATGGLAVNVLSVYVLAGDEMGLNERGAFYHLLGDAGGSVAVIVSTVVVSLTGIRAVDPVTAGLIAAAVLWSAGRVLRESGDIFLHRTAVDAAAVRDALTDLGGVDRVVDLHAWRVCSHITVASTHVETSVETLAEAEAVNSRVHAVLADHGVDHATVELCAAVDDRHTRVADHTH